MKQRGFTLIETVVYIGLFSVLMTGSVVTLYALLTSIADNRAVLATYTEVQFVTQKLTWALSGATVVTVTSSSSLEINRPDLGSDNPLVFFVKNEQFYISRGNGPGTVLSGPGFPITGAEFIIMVPPLTSETEVILKYSVRGTSFQYRTFTY